MELPQADSHADGWRVCNGCEKGIEMCRISPCKPTPDEAIVLLDRFGIGRFRWRSWDKLSQEPRLENENERYEDYEGSVIYLIPMIECYPTRACTFLTDDNLCALHDLELKPLEGRMACCKQKNEGFRAVLLTWDNDRRR